METTLDVARKLFQNYPPVRYVSVYQEGKLYSEQRPALINASSSESDLYEELLVNPTLLTLAEQRGNIDCGGLNFILVGYGHFNQFIMNIPNGHISICISKESGTSDIVEDIYRWLLAQNLT